MRILHLALAVAIAVSATACKRNETSTTSPAPPVSAPSAPAALPRVTTIDLGKSLAADGRIAAGQETFAPTDTIYASVGTNNASASTLTVRWTFEDGQLVSEGKDTVAGGDRAATEFHISKPDGWPAGRYKVEIALNGQPAGTREFEVR